MYGIPPPPSPGPRCSCRTAKSKHKLLLCEVHKSSSIVQVTTVVLSLQKRSVTLSSLFQANVKYEKNRLKQVSLWHVEIPTKWKVYKSFSRSKHRPPCWKCSVYVTLTQTVEFHLKVRCTAWQEVWNSISSHCVTSRDKVMWHYGCWLCKNVITRKLGFLSSFEFVFIWVCVK